MEARLSELFGFRQIPIRALTLRPLLMLKSGCLHFSTKDSASEQRSLLPIDGLYSLAPIAALSYIDQYCLYCFLNEATLEMQSL